MKQQYKYKIFFLLLFILAVAQCKGTDNSPWVMKIDGKKITLKELKAARKAYLATMAQQFQVTPKQLREYLNNPEKAGRPEMVQMLRKLRAELSLEGFREKYKQMLLLNKEAKKSGYLKRQDIKDRVKFLKLYGIANMYLLDKLQSSEVQISDKDAIDACEAARKEDPRVRNLPIAQCMEFARQNLTLQHLAQKQQQLLQDIVAAYKIEKNPKVDLEKLDDQLNNKKEEQKEHKEESSQQ
ncbi:MAG: hypothetical protein D6767_09505 [Candidatus Hydrogenedentota bacterium]|nr:MAG: hypothetical protein D6767_09505 [Candidatus Hydrogenedentota bacterium]